MKKAGTPEEATSPTQADYSTSTAVNRQGVLYDPS